jgi:hypothetical protein
VASHHADEGRGANAQRRQDHGEEGGFVDMLLGAKADGKGAAGGDQSRARVAQPDTEPRQMAMGRTKMSRRERTALSNRR